MPFAFSHLTQLKPGCAYLRLRTLLRTLAFIIAGAPALLLAQYSATNMSGGYNISPTAAASGGIFAGTYSPGFQSAAPVIYQPATGWAGLPVGMGFVSSLYGIHFNYWGAATAISHDGTVVAGSTTGELTSGSQASYATYWTNGVELLLPPPPDDPNATAMNVTAISGDGSTLVVQDFNNSVIYGEVESYVYNIATGTFTSLGFFPGTTNQQTYATATSKDGTTVAGYYQLDNGDKHGFLWKVARGMTDIGVPASAVGASFTYLQPNCISDDGTTLFGTLSIGNGWGGFRYNTTNGFQDLGDFLPTACTSDGREAVGPKGLLNYAAIWSAGTGSGTVADLLSANGIAPSPTGFAVPVSISPDGSAMTTVIPNPINGEHYATVTPVLITLPVPLKTVAVPLAKLLFQTPYQETLNEPAGTLMQYADFNTGVSAVLVSAPHHAAAFALNADGSFTYTPKPGYISAPIGSENGTPPDTFIYHLVNPSGTSTNVVVQITVEAPTSPTVDTPTSTNVTTTTATLGGIVESDGGAAITGVGVVYAAADADSNPQIDDGLATTATGNGTTGVFTVNVSGLTPNTLYSFEAYATNSQGISYSGAGFFVTLANFSSWQQIWFTDPASASAALTADPYLTGVQNIQVFAYLGPYQDPTTATPAQLPQVQRGGGNLFYSFTEPGGVTGITYGARWSATMQPSDWHAVPDTGDPTATPPTHIFSMPMTGPHLYMRLTLTVQYQA